MKKVKPSVYEVETKSVNQTILIVVEGQTEKLYFGSFPVLTLTVKVVDLKGQSKRKLVEATKHIVSSSDVVFDRVWCVFDMDIRQSKNEFSDFDNAIEMGHSKDFKVAYSNDCFELWFYLHYHYTDQKNHRKFYYKQIGEKWGCNYEKECKRYDFCGKLYALLETDENAYQSESILRARRLYEIQKELTFHEQNPITLVYELVEFLNRNCRK